MPRLSIQLCTYNRAPLLERVLEACFDQTLAPDAYEIVLVNDGSSDATPAAIERAARLATCRLTVVHQANAGLAKARNAGIARCTGERIAFIDDDVLPTPAFAEEHLRTDERHGDVVVRGAVINTESFDRLPSAAWSLKNYSANWFWTSNVSVRRARLDAVGGRFDESFSEYGWEDIELGLRLRAIGTKAVFNRRAVAFHYKPRPKGTNVAGMLRQVRAQARTAVRLERLHPSWRVALAIGDTVPQRLLGAAVGSAFVRARLERLVGEAAGERRLSPARLGAARLLASAAYYEELARAKQASPSR
ncbi:MAG TPA: glycosyltransferase family A protein [Candidatus Baltobacteraceae bacterium]|nr:glycosyltransferase family A protein [Candidatus Baltobacteraceae bacterium]